MTHEYHDSLYGALPGDRSFQRTEESGFVHRRNPRLVAEACSAIQLRRQLEWIDNVHKASLRHRNEEMLG